MEEPVQQTITDAGTTETNQPVEQPTMIEGLDYTRYTGSSVSFTVRNEITYGDVLVSTLMVFLIVIVLIHWFHSLILKGRGK